MTTIKTRQQLALDMLLKRADNKLNSKLQFRDDNKHLVLRAVQATNEMFASSNSTPFLIQVHSVVWSQRWLDANGFKKPLYPPVEKVLEESYEEATTMKKTAKKKREVLSHGRGLNLHNT